MIIDAHHHLWDVSRGYSWLDDKPAINRTFTAAELRAVLAANGIDHTVLVEAGRCDPAEANEFVAIAEQTPEIVGVVAWCDLTATDLALPGLPESALTAPGLAAPAPSTSGLPAPGQPASGLISGARSQLQAETDPGYLSRRDVRAGLQSLADRNLTFDLVVRVDQLRACAEAAKAVPQLTFVLDHLGKPSIRDGAAGHRAWLEAITRLAAQPNVLAKLSGLVTEAGWDNWRPAQLHPFIDTALDLFGPRRLMFGSDWPVCLLAASYEQVLEALAGNLTSLSSAERDEIFSGTAIRAYGLTL